MDTQASMYILSGALVLTILSACGATFGFEAQAKTASPASEVRVPEPLSLDALRQRLRETQSLVRDPQLAIDIAVSREAIRDVMADPSKFDDAGVPRDLHGLAR